MPHTPEHTRTRKTYVGLFDDRKDADRAARELRTAGFKDEDIGYAWKDDEGVHKEGDTKAGEMAAGGAVTGAALGGLMGAAAAGLIPGVGPIVAGGILASTLTGAAVGTAAGGISGALVGMGIPDDEAKYYDEEFRRGRTLMTVRANDRYADASDIARRGRGWDYETRNEQRARLDERTRT
ncbi:MAG TPA: hypothetical protein VFM93_02270 [Candidatus Limnocylindria bacterium]|nr:hypothetical protein [Candidatus Limnocylindria bacterium]